MHARLGRKQPVSEFAFNAERGRFDAGLTAGLLIEYLDLEPFPLGPTQVHPEQHLGKILCVGAARTGLDRADGVVGVGLAREQALRLGLADLRFEPRDQLFELFGGIGVGLGEFEKDPGVGNAGLEFRLLFEGPLDAAPLLDDLLGALRIIPEIGVGNLLFEFF